MANGTQLYFDNFPGSSLNAAWTAFPGRSLFQVSGNTAEPVTANSSVSYAGYLSTTLNADQYIEFQTAATYSQSSGYINFYIRSDANLTGHGYFIQLANGSNYIYRINGFVQLKNFSMSIAAGDIIRVEAVGPNITVSKNGALVTAVMDGDTLGTGYVGIQLLANTGSNINQSAVTNLRAGNIMPTSATGIWQKYGPVVYPTSYANSNLPGTSNQTMLYEANSQLGLASAATPVFKMWFNDNDGNIYYAESLDGISFTRRNTAVITNASLPRIFKNAGTYYIYAAPGTTWTSVDQYTSSDGIAWTKAHTSVISTGGVGTWDHDFLGYFQVVDIVGGTWRAIYDGANNSLGIGAGLATSSDGVTWTKYASNPVVPQSANMAGGWDVHKINGVYYGWANNSSPGAATECDISHWQSNDLITWTNRVVDLAADNDWEGMNWVNGGAAIPSLIEANGNTYMYYSASPYDTVTNAAFLVSVAKAPCTLLQLVSGQSLLARHQQVAFDNFTSGPGDLSSDWTTPTHFTKLAISSGYCQASVINTNCGMYYSGGTFSDDQYSEITIQTLASSCFDLPTVRMQTNGDCYYLSLQGPTNSQNSSLVVLSHNGTTGVNTQIGPTLTVTPQVGDKFRLSVVGNVLTAYQNGIQIFQATDYPSYIPSGGKPGIFQWAVTSTANAQISAWSGGNANVAPSYTVTSGTATSQTIVRDTFFRADSGTLGSNWTSLSDATDTQVLGTTSHAAKVQATGGRAAAFWKSDTFANDQYSEVIAHVSATGTNDHLDGVIVRATSSGYYLFTWNALNTGSCMQIAKVISGTFTSLATATNSFAVDGCVMRLEVVGTTLNGYVNGNLVLTASDASLTSGAPGITGYMTAASPTATMTNWEGGDLIWTRRGTAIAAGTTGGTEEPTVIYEANPQILTANADGKIFKMWYTNGWAPQNTYPLVVNYAESNDGLTWTNYASNPVISNGSTPVAHGYVFHHGSTYYAYYGNDSAASTGLDLWTSSDGINWSLTHPLVLSRGSAGKFDANSLDNPVVWTEGSTWYMLYTGLLGTEGAGGTYQVGLATSSDGITWTKYANNPVITTAPGGTAANGKVIVKANSTYYLMGFITPSSGSSTNLPTDIAVWASSDLHTWVPSTKNPIYKRVLVNEGVNLTGGQVADPIMVFVNNQTYMYYDTIDTQAANKIHINVATAPYTIQQLLQLSVGTFVYDDFNRADGSLGGFWSSVIPNGAESMVNALAGGIQLHGHGFGPIAAGAADATAQWTGLTFGNNQWARARVNSVTQYKATLSITAATQSGGNTTYTYTTTTGSIADVISGGQLLVHVTGMQNAGNNGFFMPTTFGTGTFTVANASGVTESGSTGVGHCPGDSGGGVMVRASGTNKNNINGYFYHTGLNSYWQGSWFGRMAYHELWKVVNGVGTCMALWQSDSDYDHRVPNVGDTIAVSAIGSTITAWHNGYPLLSVTDTAVTSGVPGIWTFSMNGPDEYQQALWTSVVNPPGMAQITFTGYGASDSGTDPSTPLAADIFPYANASDLNTVNPFWVNAQGTHSVTTISGHQVVASSTTGVNLAYRSDAAAGADQWSEVKMYETGTASYQNAGPAVRISTGSGNSCYCVQIASNVYNLSKQVNGVFTNTLGSYGGAHNSGDIVRLAVVGNQLTVYLNGWAIITATDNDLTTGYPGIFGAYDGIHANTNGIQDSWKGGNMSLVQPVTPQNALTSITGTGSFFSAPLPAVASDSKGYFHSLPSATKGTFLGAPIPVVFTDARGYELTASGDTLSTFGSASVPVVICNSAGYALTPPVIVSSNGNAVTFSSTTGAFVGAPIPVVLCNASGYELLTSLTAGAYVGTPVKVVLTDNIGNPLTLI